MPCIWLQNVQLEQIKEINPNFTQGDTIAKTDSIG